MTVRRKGVGKKGNRDKSRFSLFPTILSILWIFVSDVFCRLLSPVRQALLITRRRLKD